MLSWEEREAGLPGQPPLPGLTDVPTPAERVFLLLARRWHAAFTVVESDQAPPRVVDEIALAAALLACEYGTSFTGVAEQQAQANIALAETRSVAWMDRLPWRLVIAARGVEPGQAWELEELVCNLDHHNSALRVWTMEVAWMVHPWLERETALPLLLANVANTLAGVDTAWGLAGTLFDSVEDFYAAAESWQPEDFADQYAQRVALLKSHGLTTAQASLWKTEAACRRLIADAALAFDGA